MNARAAKPGYAVIEVPNPPPGERYLLMALDEQLVLATTSLIANGSAERELARRIEQTLREFLASQPIDLHVA